MRRKRKETKPPTPRNLITLRDFLQSRDWEHLGKINTDPPQPFFRHFLQVEDGTEILVFFSPEVSRHLNISRSLHMDETFQVVPRGLGSYQLMTIHTVYLNKVYAAIYAIMTRKTKAACVELLRYVKSEHNQMEPLEAMCDFEIAQREAICEVFPEIQARGCWFHFAQAVWKRHHQIGMFQLCNVNTQAKKILQMFMGLPLLPAHLVSDGMDYLEEQINIPNLTLEFADFVSYVHNYWLHQVGVHIFSVHGCPRRTNNDVESFHSQLYIQSGKQAHPPVWDFIRILVEMDWDISLKFRTHKDGGKHSRARRQASEEQDSRIREADNMLMSDDGNSPESAIVMKEVEKIDDDTEKIGVPFVKISDESLAKQYGLMDQLQNLVYFEKQLPSIFGGNLRNSEEVLAWLPQQKTTDSIEEVTEEIVMGLIKKSGYVFTFSIPEDCDTCEHILHQLEHIDDETDEHGILLITTKDVGMATRTANVTSFPALVLYRNGEPVVYDGNMLEEQDILRWVTSEEVLDLPGAIEEVNSKMLEKLLNRSHSLAVLFC